MSKCEKTSTNFSDRKTIGLALIDCSTLRGGTIAKDQLRLYAARLSKQPLEDVLMALEKLAEMPRKEYEPAMLEIGSLLALTEVCTIARKNRESLVARRTTLAMWRCPDCNSSCSGLVDPEDFCTRRCNGIPLSKRTDGNRICGAAMTEIQRIENYRSEDART